MPKIVLVTLIHNRRSLLPPCIESAANQTLDKSKWMYLLVDNGSDDGADLVAEEFVKTHDNATIVRMGKNLGQQAAYNYVLNDWLVNRNPEAEIMAVLDSDDMLVPEALQEVENMFDAHPEIGHTYSGFAVIDGSGEITCADHPKSLMVPNQFMVEGQKHLRRLFIKNEGPIIGHFRAYSIKCLRDVGGFNEVYQYATDCSMAARMLERYPVVKIDKVLYLWRYHDNQIQAKDSVLQSQCWQEIQIEFARHCIELRLL